ncbi:extracellular serine/threonine protein kinase FAM20C-like isoform X1 [Lineus longissimus]|uniref:extracellular serine/threonine protein kinase FAM20C-like isoform X1 n=1 Tax=Lineus longissimus TaxID=88925 RepID=UPI00315C72DF
MALKFKQRFVFLFAFMGMVLTVLVTATVLHVTFEHRLDALVPGHLTAHRGTRESYEQDSPNSLLVQKEQPVGKFDRGYVTIVPTKKIPHSNKKLGYISLISDDQEQYVRRRLSSHRKALRRRGKKLLPYKIPKGFLNFILRLFSCTLSILARCAFYREKLPPWVIFHNEVSQNELYNEEVSEIDEVLKSMATEEIFDCVLRSGGTQLKLIVTFQDEGQAMMKPMRFSRETETLPNHFYFSDYERHNAEIASFHLDRILGFRRVPPCAGRVFNISHEIQRFADRTFGRTFFISPAGNLCFHGTCSYYCDTGHAFCGNPGMIEGSLCAYLPHATDAPRKLWRNPWKRSYSKRRRASWEVDDSYCHGVRKMPPYNKGRRLLDLIDLAVFDFLTGNMDRHHYETFQAFGNETFLIHFDQGRAFGKSMVDEMSILAPMYQCCLIRKSTFDKLTFLNSSQIKLSHLMRKSLLRDKVAPVLTEGHLLALDRRVGIMIEIIYDCLMKYRHGSKHIRGEVIVDDGH